MAVREALVIGTSSYEDSRLNRLRSPGLDAMELSDVLSDPGIGGYAVRPVIDQPSHVVRREIERFFRARRPDDQLLLYLSCHGIKDSKLQLYFAAADTDRDLLESTSVPAAFVNGRLVRCGSRKILVLLDCCYSGAFRPGGAKSADTAVHLLEEFKDTGVAVITATDALQQAWEGEGPVTETGEGQLSVFTAAAVEGLRSGRADRDGDGWVSVEDLYGHVREEMLARDARQSPLRWVLGGQGTLKVARRAAPDGTGPVRLPRPLPTLGTPAVEVLTGITSAAAPLRRTLGPVPRRVLLTGPDGVPYSSTDTREIVAALPTGSGHAALGVGLVRDLVADQYRRAQDGTATAVVLFEAMVRALQPALAGGSHPTPLARTVSEVLDSARKLLTEWNPRPVAMTQVDVGRVVPPEVFSGHVVRAVHGAGLGAFVLVEPSAGSGITSRVSDACVLGGHLSPYLPADEVTGRTALRDASVLVCGQRLSSASDARWAVSYGDKRRPLVVVAPAFDEEAHAALAGHFRDTGRPCMAVAPPALSRPWRAVQCEIASHFTGACVAVPEATAVSLGSARLVVATTQCTALVRDRGSPEAHAEYVEKLRTEMTPSSDPALTEWHLLTGKVAEVFVGGSDERARHRRVAQVRLAVRRAQAALVQGVLPGEAAALAALGRRLHRDTRPWEERPVEAALKRALAQPLWALAENHGERDPAKVVEAVQADWPAVTYEAVHHRGVVPSESEYVWTPATHPWVMLHAVEAAVTAYLSLI
ncbi:caspase family protein [Streptomyces sp. NBC_01278]|uniref:caspase, EACC1-associated type n=1 Tax=Streptomyces sp. NBC_01278 TaxID=2903809 RepID=UPI002E370F38|nr:caspase family protein [Streptomyces sp. NBC_01278]